jgi:L-lactate dehydrogenase complex protein LldG
MYSVIPAVSPNPYYAISRAISIILVKKSSLLARLEDSAELLRDLLTRGGASYTAYITGPSRTADIERVGALGVHGPLELHIVLLED